MSVLLEGIRSLVSMKITENVNNLTTVHATVSSFVLLALSKQVLKPHNIALLLECTPFHQCKKTALKLKGSLQSVISLAEM